MRSLWLTDSCKDIGLHALNNPIERNPQSWLQVERGKLARVSCTDPSSFYNSSLIKLAEPPIEPHFKPIDYVEVLAQIHEELEATSDNGKSDLYLLQSQVFRGLGEAKLLRQSLRSAWRHASTSHEKLVYAAWLKHEKQGEEMIRDLLSKCVKCEQEFTFLDINAEFSQKAASSGSSNSPILKNQGPSLQGASISSPLLNDVVFHIEDEDIVCDRQKIAAMSAPFHAMLNGCFTESRLKIIDLSENGISARGMHAVCEFSKTGELNDLSPDVLLDILAFANRFCCEQLKDACDRSLASFIHTKQDAIAFIEYGLEESSQVLVASCLQVILQELPDSLHDEQVAKIFYNIDSRKRSIIAGRASFSLYSLLSEVAMKDNMSSDKSVFFLQCLRECATTNRQKAFALHQLGCVMLARKEYDKAESSFDAAVKEGHLYSSAGLGRAKYMRGYKHAAYEEISSLLSSCRPLGWMYQERALYCDGKEKWLDLDKATELDPTLTYPYMYRATVLMREQSAHAALAEINRVLGFKLTLDCLELRTCFYLALQDYRAALCDIQAILTLNPNYMLYGGRLGASQLHSLLIPHVEHWTTADCWMQLYDRWSSVDDIGSLAVIYQMIDSDSGKGLLFFRQSLLLLRLNCPEAAMRSLQLARQHANCEHERLVYEGWILYDTGHCEEGLAKAEESIAIQRSFEAFFLKAYALADSSQDQTSSATVVALLEEALKCPSDGLRKGQALNNLGSVYVDWGKLDLAADCYVSALKIRHTRAHQGLARVHYLKNDKNAAYEEMTKLIEKARNKASAYEKRSEYCDREMTKADLQMVTQLDPLRVYPYRYRAAVLMDNHQEEEAIAELSRAIAFKADLHLLHLRAAFHEFIGDVAGALRDCRAALSVDPNHQEIMELHSRVHSQEP
uniref:BTB domain-containing protein n=1 Tax=Araucaria cunninghamii TaxID=56994 RepID=A0A0D6QVT2_ARACU